MIILYSITAILLVLSLVKNPLKTKKALAVAFKQFRKITPPFIMVLVLISIVFYLIPEKTILYIMNNESQWLSLFFAVLVGSVSVMPGFVAFPISGILLSKGVTHFVISGFTTTMMMVGVLTFPLEKKYLGLRVTILRNLFALLTALITAFATGLFYGELF